ncbi:unnamed protein product [Orchesella dallaii]|uniref:CRAL-TRIO domain-containing protein n=1 Tax=Orchesella dallaii TaxID=48710 RepID=A0ABP1R0S8_9HEXA
MAHVKVPLEEDTQGLEEIRRYNKEFLNSYRGSRLVREFLEEASTNEDLLVRFLRGRKYRSQRAWETLKRYAEVRFDVHPEVFPQKYPEELHSLQENPLLGVLKSRDSLGRRIMFINASDWEPDQHSMEIMTIASVLLAERLLLDEDALTNGIVFIQQCSGVGMKQAHQYTLRAMRRLVNIFWYAFPLKIKEIYYLNVPTVLSCAFAMVRPFLTKKLKERLNVTGTGKPSNKIYENFSPNILPKCLGGVLDIHDAVDTSFLKF